MKKQRDRRRFRLKLKWITRIYILLMLLVFLVLLDQIRLKHFENVFLCLLTLILFFIPSFVERRIHIDVPDTLEAMILLFIFAAEILGEIQSYYLVFPFWDTMLHTANGFLSAAIGLSLIDILNKHDRFSISLSPFFVALVAFCFSMTIGVLWEIFEFGMDRLLAFDMQKDTYINQINTVLLNPNGENVPIHIVIGEVSVNEQPWPAYIDIGLLDTMKDLIVNLIGAALFSVFGYFYVKRRGKAILCTGFCSNTWNTRSICSEYGKRRCEFARYADRKSRRRARQCPAPGFPKLQLSFPLLTT